MARLYHRLDGSDIRSKFVLPFRELSSHSSDLGFHSLREFHPRLYRLVAFGDKN